MKIAHSAKKVRETPQYSGRVKVTVSGLDQYSQLMSGRQGLPAKVFIVSETTLDEVYNLVRKAVEECCEEE